jgi:peptidoglycan/xylan/chitin deacetylase (PgdA/CDA1 family)
MHRRLGGTAAVLSALIAGLVIDAGGASASVERDWVAVAPGGGPHVRTFTVQPASTVPGASFFAYDAGFAGGVRVASGDLDADGVDEVVTSAGFSGGPHVRAFAESGSPLGPGFLAYDPGFAGGVDVAVADLDGDGTAEIITAAGPGGGPHVKAFSFVPRTGAVAARTGFMAYSPRFAGGVQVTAGDLDGDGRAEIITGAGPNGGPHVRIFRGDGTPLGEGFMAYDPAFRGGVDVAAADLDGDGRVEIITSAGPGGGPHVRTFAFSVPGGAVPRASFFAYDAGFAGGVRTAAGNVVGDGRAEIVTGAGFGGGPHVRTFTPAGVPINNGFSAFDPTYTGGIDVAVMPTQARVVTGAGGAWAVRQRDRPVVHLTFDDGPSPIYTPQVLDVLRRFDARATFFQVGREAAAHPELMHAVLADGHVLANHTWLHEDLTRLSRAQFDSTVSRTRNVLGPRAANCLRPPYGAVNSRVESWAHALGYRIAGWTIDTSDYQRRGVATIVRNALSGVTDGSVILLHDGGGDRTQTVAALPEILTALRDRGFRFEPMCA